MKADAGRYEREKWDDPGPVLGYIGCGVIFFVIVVFVLIVVVSYTLATRGG